MTQVLGQPSRDRPAAVFTVTDVLAPGVLTAARGRDSGATPIG
jgi:DNA-binding LacI/PurR family transcriptional regulator